MRRADREIKDPIKIKEILDKAKILHLGLFDNGYPYIVPLHYGYQYSGDELRFFMHCAKEGHKLDLLRADACVCVELESSVELVPGGDTACNYGSTYASVIGRGRAEIVEDAGEKALGLRLLMKNQTGRDFKFPADTLSNVAVIKVTVEEFTAKGRLD